MSQPLVRADNPYSIFRLPEALTCWPAVSVMAASFLVAALVFALGGALVTEQVFNVRASYDDEAETLVAHFIAKGAKSVAVFYQDDGFGLAVLSGTEKALKKRNMLVAAKGTFQRNTLAIKGGMAAMLGGLRYDVDSRLVPLDGAG